MNRFSTFFLFLFLSFFCLNSLSLAQYIVSEDFSSLTFPPTGWTRGPALDADDGPVWSRSTQSGYATGSGSAFCYFYNWPSGTDSLTGPVFTSTTAGDSLYFDHAYRTYISEVEELRIFTSTDGGATWTEFQYLPGGPTVGTGMVTAAPSTSNFISPTAGQWASKKYALPVGTNRFRFQTTTAYGNNLFLDNIRVGQPPLSDVQVNSISISGAVILNNPVTLSGSVTNNAPTPATFTITRTISPGGYTSTQTVIALNGGATQSVPFDPWTFIPSTTYLIRDSVFLAGDSNPLNDTTSTTVTPSVPKTFVIINADNASKDSVIAHMTAAGIAASEYDVLTTLPAISFSHWKTMIVVFSSGSGWSATLRDSMKSFLDNANSMVEKKTLLIFGNDLGYNFDPLRNISALPADTVFYRQYLRAQYIADNWLTTVPYSTYKKFYGVGPFSTITADSSTDPYPDLVRPASWNGGFAAFVPFAGGGDSCNAIYFTGTYYNLFYGTNTYSRYVSEYGATESNQSVFNTIMTYVNNNGGALPVELTSFTANDVKGNVFLSWETKTEVNSNKFEVERSIGGVWNTAGEVNASGNSNSPKKYSFNDKLQKAGSVLYRLKMIDNDGSFSYSDVIETEVGLPIEFSLGQNYPNPFNPATRIEYQLPVDSRVTIEIFSVTGERIAEIVNLEQTAGYYTVDVNSNLINKSLASGIYLYRLNASAVTANRNYTSVKKMILIK